MKTIRRTIFWTLTMGMWVLSAYLFATGNIWGGVGVGVMTFVMWVPYLVIFVVFAGEVAEAAEEGRKKAQQAAYEEERNRFRSA